jgi:hypothetical protein
MRWTTAAVKAGRIAASSHLHPSLPSFTPPSRAMLQKPLSPWSECCHATFTDAAAPPLGLHHDAFYHAIIGATA